MTSQTAMLDPRKELLETGATCVCKVNRPEDLELIRWAKDRKLFLYIGRANRSYGYEKSIWHNPYRDKDPDQAIRKFKEYINTQPELLKRIPELRGHLLGCWCYPNPCHGDVLARLANESGVTDAD